MRGKLREFIGIFASGFILAQTVGSATSQSAGDQNGWAEVQSKEKLVDLAKDYFEFNRLGKPEEQETFTAFFQSAQEGNQSDFKEKAGNVQASWIEWLCKDLKASAKVSPSGIQLSNAKIVGDLNLAWLKIAFPFSTSNCVFTGKITLDNCSIPGLQFQNTCIQKHGLTGLGLTVERDLIMSGFRPNGTVSLRNAIIRGAILADGAIFRRDPPPADPKAHLPPALDLRQAKIGNGISLKRCTGQGAMVFQGAQIEGTLDCEGASFDGRANDPAHPDRADDVAFYADSIRVTGDLWFCNQFSATKAVIIRGGTIGGKVDCHKGSFSDFNSPAIDAASIRVGTDVFLRDGFKSHGHVNFRGATIGGNLDCDGGEFEANLTAPSEDPDIHPALTAASAKIDGSVFLRACKEGEVWIDFFAHGDLDFITSSIGRTLELKSGTRLDKDSALILRNAKIGTLLNRENSWPAVGKLEIQGLVFNDIDYEASPSAETELKWLGLQKAGRFFAQPYEQMAGALQRMGLQEDAVEVLIEKNKRFGPDAIEKNWGLVSRYSQRYSAIPFWQLDMRIQYLWKALKCLWKMMLDAGWYYGLGWLICYGYLPWRALIPSVIIILLGWGVFRSAYKKGILIPTDNNPWKINNKEKIPNAAFNAFIYSLEKFVPLVKLEMGDYWIPDAKCGSGRAILCFLYLHILAGWVLTTLWVGGLTGLLKT